MHLWAVCMPTFSGWNFSLQLNRQIHVPLFLSVPVTTNLPFALFTWHPCQCLVCPACYIPLARWGHTPRPLLNFDISKHLVNMLILSHHCRLAHTADIQDALKGKKMFLKQHCKSNLADVSCHVFGHQSCLVKKPRKEREVDRGGKKKVRCCLSIYLSATIRLALPFDEVNIHLQCWNKKENHNYSFQPKLRKRKF